jgi:RNA polymerase-binding transcription factor DksA
MVSLNSDVLDECDIAYAFEENERALSIAKILINKPKNRTDRDLVLVDGLECDLCGYEIPLERQRIVLTINLTCEYCVACQEIIDKQERLYA